MDKKELIEKISKKKEFSELPKKDVENIFLKFNKENLDDEDKIKKTRDLLRKVYSVFTSKKLLNLKQKEVEWFLKKHISTKERFEFYPELYSRLLSSFSKKLTIFDLGSGINGFSYNFFQKEFNYISVEAIGQLVSLQNEYFKKNHLNAKSIHASLFDLKALKEIILDSQGEKVIFLFKVIDSLEMAQQNFSKTLLVEITPLVNFVVISFATKSLIKKRKFLATRNWIYYFIKERFKILDDFNLGTERYLVFSKKENLKSFESL